MSSLPPLLSVITVVGVTGMLATTCVVLYGGAVKSGLGRGRSALLASVSAVLLGGWFALSAAIAAGGGYRAQLGHQIPWMPVVVVGFLVTLLALARAPVAARALGAADMRIRLLLPHTFRIAGGTVFLAAMALGQLPPLFALPAGLGDIAIGIAAPIVARKLARGTADQTVKRFTLLGITDLIVALVLGALVGFHLLPFIPPVPAISDLPIVLIPTVAVPLLLALHITTLLEAAQHSAPLPQSSTKRPTPQPSQSPD